MYVVSVQSVSVKWLSWNVISCYTRTTDSSVVVCVVKFSNANVMLWRTLRDVLPSVNMHFDVYDWVCREVTLFTAVVKCTGKILEFRVASAEISVSPESFDSENKILKQSQPWKITVRPAECLERVSWLCWKCRSHVVQYWCQSRSFYTWLINL